MSTFEELGDQLYPTAKQRVQDREFALFGKRRVPLDEAMPTGYWRTPYTVYRHPTMGIVSGVGSSMDPISFGKNFPRYSDIVQQALVGYCGSDVRCLYREQDRGYGVVTLGELVNYVFPLMDRSIFIPELLDKKEGYGYYY